MRYKIWDHFEGRFLTETESHKFGIGADGRLYEFKSNSEGGYTWVSKTACPDYYEIEFK
jgi:hypothetical protein